VREDAAVVGGLPHRLPLFRAELNLAGLAMRAERKGIDKIVTG
jgi:hypothetical protein